MTAPEMPGMSVEAGEETAAGDMLRIEVPRHEPESVRRAALLTRRRRLAQVAAVLSRHGAGYLLVRFGLADLLPLHKGRLGHAPAMRHTRAPITSGWRWKSSGRRRSSWDSLPPAPISCRPPMSTNWPSSVIAFPKPAAAIRQVIEREFGRPVAEVFARFDDEPLASASIGQVHAARLFTGEEVVVKVQKPGVAEQVEIDLRLLLDLAQTAERRSSLGREYDVVAIVNEFAWTLRGELDYEQEGRNAATFRRQFAGNRDIIIPLIYWPQTTRRVLTMQRLSGVTIDDLAGLDRLGIDRHGLAVRSADLIFSEVFEHGFYHADPHPGNSWCGRTERSGRSTSGWSAASRTTPSSTCSSCWPPSSIATPSEWSMPLRRSESLGSRHVAMRSRETWPTCSIAMWAGR